ncbi:HAD hydrolase family protein [Neobacillus sp. NPDC097160]
MLSFVENSVAMGNVVDQVKEVAKYVTNHVNEDGILRGLELVGLLEKEAV